MSFTFVTGLYNISREQYDNRSYQQYQEWFKQTLLIPVPMVIYTEICNKEIIDKYRKNIPTKVIYKSYEETPFYHTRYNVENIIKNTDFKNQIKNPSQLEYICFDYIPIVQTKCMWMIDAIKNNYFQTEMFFWIDAGLSRFLNFDISKNKFNDELIQYLQKEKKLFFEFGRENIFNSILNNQIHFDELIGSCLNIIKAGFWGGHYSFLSEICKKCSNMYIEELINKNRVDNEQVLIGYILKDYVSNTYFVKENNYVIYSYYLFCKQT